MLYHWDISIHALREEGDAPYRNLNTVPKNISIHALREEGDLLGMSASLGAIAFLSTPSARRATAPASAAMLPGCNFYPRPPRGGRRQITVLVSRRDKISIHALREEGDGSWKLCSNSARNFYPRPPRGGRHRIDEKGIKNLEFLSTPSARRATRHHSKRRATTAISIHALREEGDEIWFLTFTYNEDFYPRPPRGGRRQITVLVSRRDKISIHALREEGDHPHHGWHQ